MALRRDRRSAPPAPVGILGLAPSTMRRVLVRYAIADDTGVGSGASPGVEGRLMPTNVAAAAASVFALIKQTSCPHRDRPASYTVIVIFPLMRLTI